ncbi:MAG: copper-binding protein [Candidatus Entotheonellia bacterium]
MSVPDLKPALVSLGSAFAASLCCLLPLAIIVLGLGSGAFMATTMRYQTILLPIGILGVAMGYVLYFRERRRCRTLVCTMAGSRVNLLGLIVATAILAGELGLVTFPETASAFFTGAMVSAADRREHFEAMGTIVGVDAAKPSVTINHGEIKGLMSPMTMAFPMESPELLQGVASGDRVTFQLLRTPKSLSVVALTEEVPAGVEHVVLDVQGMS